MTQRLILGVLFFPHRDTPQKASHASLIVANALLFLSQLLLG